MLNKSKNIQEQKVGVDYSSDINSDNNEITLKESIIKLEKWIRYLLSKWRLILFAGIIGGSIGLAYAYSKKFIYTAELSFVLEDAQTNGGGIYMGIASQFGIDLGGSGGGAFTGENLLQLMQSRSMIEKALLTPINLNNGRKTLAELYIDMYDMRKTWKSISNLKDFHFLPNTDRSKFSRQQDSLLGEFYKKIIHSNLSVSNLDKKSSIISVKVNSVNELFSKFFAEALVKEVAGFYIETKTIRSAKSFNILQHQVDSVRAELNSAIIGVASSVDVNPNPNQALQVLKVPTQRRSIDVQANQAMLTELVKNLEITKMSLRRETPFIQIIDNPILPLEKTKLSKRIALLQGCFISSFIIIIYLIIKKTISDS